MATHTVHNQNSYLEAKLYKEMASKPVNSMIQHQMSGKQANVNSEWEGGPQVPQVAQENMEWEGGP